MFLPTLEEADLKPFQDVLINTPDEESVEPEDLVDCFADEDLEYDEEDDDGGPSDPPEMLILPLPSNISSVKIQPALQSLVSTEVELRKGQANDALEGLRIGLANKSLLLQTNVNNSTSTKQSTRAWASVRNAQSQILQHANDYQRAWQAITCLGTPEDMSLYQKLEVGKPGDRRSGLCFPKRCHATDTTYGMPRAAGWKVRNEEGPPLVPFFTASSGSSGPYGVFAASRRTVKAASP